MERLVELVQRRIDDEAKALLRANAKRCFIDTLGVLIGGWRTPTVQAVRNAIGGGGRTISPTDLAMLLGTAAHVLEFDDSHYRSLAHPSAVLVPTVLAVGRHVNGPVGDALDAYAIGLDVNVTIGNATSRGQYYDRGFHTTGTVGVFGAAAAASRLIGLDAVQIKNALGIAASCASGIRANFGTDMKPIHAGRAAASGVLAARLAMSGVSASSTAVFGENGFSAAYASRVYKSGELPIDAHAGQWALLADPPAVKKFPSCGATHSAVTAAIALSSRPSVRAALSHPVEIVVQLSKASLSVINDAVPRTPVEAQFSVSFCVAAALVDGCLTLKHFSRTGIQRPDILSLMEYIRLEESIEYSRVATEEATFPARVTVVSESGMDTDEVLVAPGAADQPLSDDELKEKFFGCLPDDWDDQRGQQVLDMVGNADSPIGDLLSLAELT